MKQLFIIITLAILQLTNIFAQEVINVNNIEIVRDEYGVPHIFTKTDIEAAYANAWTQCEDNFHLMQESMAISKNMAGRLMGKQGAVLDYMYQVFKIEELVAERYDKDIGPQIGKMIDAYTLALNRYAATHPEEVRLKKLFPLTAQEIVGNHLLHLLFLRSSSIEIGRLLTDEFDYASLMEVDGSGSNAMAFSPNITQDGKTYLIGNPHQPVNSMGNLWEVSIHSEEGYEIFGSNLSIGGVVPGIGVNRNLGWTFTTNYPNSGDVYLLEMHPSQKNYYKYDEEWIPLEEKKIKLKAKIGPFVIPVKKTTYWSKYGPTFKKESGYYSFKSSVLRNLKLIEQWYKMGLAQNMDEFMAALNIQGLPVHTITYADKDGNILHLSNFAYPYRSEEYDWSEFTKGNSPILPGNTSQNNWDLEVIHPISDLPQIKNPKCGYVYNCNNTAYKITAPEENPQKGDFPAYFGLLESTTLRANTFEKLISQYDKISFEEIKKIRDNVSIDKHHMSFRNCTNCDDLPKMMAKYPEFAEMKMVFDKWDGSFSIDNKQATQLTLVGMYFEEYITSQLGNEEKEIPEEVMIESLRKAKKFLLKHHGNIEVELGNVQKAVRYEVEMPLHGSANTLANTHVKPHKKGMVKIANGDTFIFYAKFGKDGLEELNTINAFGNSLKKGHPHSTDQTELYVNRQTKKVELNLDKLRQSGKIYHPE